MLSCLGIYWGPLPSIQSGVKVCESQSRKYIWNNHLEASFHMHPSTHLVQTVTVTAHTSEVVPQHSRTPNASSMQSLGVAPELLRLKRLGHRFRYPHAASFWITEPPIITVTSALHKEVELRSARVSVVYVNVQWCYAPNQP